MFIITQTPSFVLSRKCICFETRYKFIKDLLEAVYCSCGCGPFILSCNKIIQDISAPPLVCLQDVLCPRCIKRPFLNYLKHFRTFSVSFLSFFRTFALPCWTCPVYLFRIPIMCSFWDMSSFIICIDSSPIYLFTPSSLLLYSCNVCKAVNACLCALRVLVCVCVCCDSDSL